MVVVTDPQQFPSGVRFQPTDEEIVNYLKRRVQGLRNDDWIIPDVEICSCDPWELSGIVNGKPRILWDNQVQEGWFYSRYKAKKVGGSTRAERLTRSGFWKQTGISQRVKARHNGTLIVIGTRNILVFHRGKGKNADKSDWVIHEYHLPGNDLDTHVLCRLKLKRDDPKTGREYWSEMALYANQPDAEPSIDEGVLEREMEEVLNSLEEPVNPENRVEQGILMNWRARTTDSVCGFVPVEEMKGVVENKFNGSPFASEKPMPRPVIVVPRIKPRISLDETAARAKVQGYKERGSAGNSTKKTNSKKIEYAEQKSNLVAASNGTTSESTKTSTDPPLANLVNVLIGIFLLLTITRQVFNL